MDGEGAVVDCDLVCNETGGEWADVGEVRVVGWWNEANVAEANAPCWVGNEKRAVVEGLEVVKQPKDGAKSYVYGVVQNLWRIGLRKLPDIVLEGWGGGVLWLDGALVRKPL